MADTTTANHGWVKPEETASDDTWGGKLNDDLDDIDVLVGGDVTTKDVSASPTLTDAECLKQLQVWNGTLAGNVTVTMPTNKRRYFVRNDTSGAYTVTAKCSGQTGVTITQGAAALIYSNGTDIVKLCELPGSSLSSTVFSLLAAANAAAIRTILGLGTSALVDTGTSGTKVALTDGANTWSATQTFKSADAGAAGVRVKLWHDSASPAASDIAAAIDFDFEDSGGNQTTGAAIELEVLDPTDTSEDAALRLKTLTGGTLTTVVAIGPGVQVGSPTGTDKGAGTVNAAAGFYTNGVKGAPSSYIYLSYEVSSGTNGGTFTSGAWRTRPLNTEVDPDNLCTLSANQFTLPAGTYKVVGTASHNRCNRTQLRIQNVTDATTLLLGAQGCSNPGSTDPDGGQDTITGVFTLAAEKVCELQHRCGTTRNTDGMGLAMSWGTEVYATLLLEKIA